MSNSENYPVPSGSNHNTTHSDTRLRGFFNSLKRAINKNTREFLQDPESTTPIIPLNTYFCPDISRGIHVETHPQNKMWQEKLAGELSLISITPKAPLHVCHAEVIPIYKHSADDAWHSVPESQGDKHVQMGLVYHIAEDQIIFNDTESLALTNEYLRIQDEIIAVMNDEGADIQHLEKKILKPAVLEETWNNPIIVNYKSKDSSERSAFFNPTWKLMAANLHRKFRMHIEIMYGYNSPDGSTRPAVIGDKCTNPNEYQSFGYYVVCTTPQYIKDTSVYLPPPLE